MDLLNGNIWLSTRGVFYRLDKVKDIKFYVNANFGGGWAQADTNNAKTFMSHLLYVIMYAGCNVLWYSKIQT